MLLEFHVCLLFSHRQIFYFTLTDHLLVFYRFRSRYHPDEFGKRKEEQQASLKNRLRVFMDLLEKGWIDSVSIDVEKSDQIIRLLDAAVIKLEGGTDFDLLSLDEKTEMEKPREPQEPDLSLFAVDVEASNKSEKEDGEAEDEEKKVSDSEVGTKKAEMDETTEKVEEEDSNNDEKSEVKPEETSSQKDVKEEDCELKEEAGEIEEGEEREEDGKDSKMDEKKPDIKPSADGTAVDESVKSEEPKPRPLHKKDSIFLRNIAPTITKAEIEEVNLRFHSISLANNLLLDVQELSGISQGRFSRSCS